MINLIISIITTARSRGKADLESSEAKTRKQNPNKANRAIGLPTTKTNQKSKEPALEARVVVAVLRSPLKHCD